MNEISRDTGDATEPSTGTKRPLDSSASGKKGDKSKRLRVSRACDQCRAARERCDGAQPTCSTCLQAERSCSYKEQPKKRGIQPNYIRTLELTLAWVFQSHPDAERKLADLLPDSQGQAHRAIAFKDVGSSDALHQVWRNGIICRQIDQMLSGAEIEIPQLSHQQHTPRPIQAVEGRLPYQSPPLSAPSDTGLLQQEQEQQLDFGETANISQRAATSDDDNQRLCLPQAAWYLLEHYFAFTQTWLPITEKHDILRLMYTYPNEGLPKASLASDHAELWGIMAWSACSTGSENFDSYKETARSLIPTKGFQYGHVKALLILSLTELAQAAWVSAWLTVGTAAGILTHLASDAAGEGTLSLGHTRHIFLATFLLESAVSSKTGALTHLRAADVQPMGLLIEDGLEEWSPWSDPSSNGSALTSKQPARSISTFNELFRLALQSNTAQPRMPIECNLLDLVVELLNNAQVSGRRRHPSSIVADFLSLQKSPKQGPSHQQNRPSNSAAGLQSQIGDFDIDYLHEQSSEPLRRIADYYPFMSIPNETTESLSGSTPAQGMASGTTPNVWPGRDLQPTGSGSANFASINEPPSAGPSPDIFEEMAILDRTDSTQNPRFMQNLGFGPDLDLAEFFGADYQPSDSMLNYMQSDPFGEIPQHYEGTVKGAS